MITEQALSILCTQQSQDTIIEQTEYSGAIRLSGYSGFTDIFPIFQSLNERRISHLLQTYKPPPITDDNFDVVKDFVNKYTRSLYFTGAWKHAVKGYNRWLACFYGRDEDYEERQMEYANPETRVIHEIMEKQAAQITREFKKGFIHTASDTALFEALSNGNTTTQIAALVYPQSKADQKTLDKVRYRVNLMHFRLACYAIAQGWCVQPLAQKTLRMYAPQFRSFFGSDNKIMPTKEQLLFAAHGDQNWKPHNTLSSTSGIPIIHKSKVIRYEDVDFNGVKHERKFGKSGHGRAVAYYADGSSYDFVNKIRRP